MTAAAKSNRFVCIHCHFYQPPRENPWLESIEEQESAAPFHDWNERITDECYRPNAAARLKDGRGRISAIANNYARVSFNVGPTLLAWLEREARDVYEAILEADLLSAEQFSGHGSAIAQAYNHMIMPLASPRDALTQVRWGIRDFQHRFGRLPEGMWLSETAVNTSVLELLAREGIKFTVLAPNQAKRVRPLGGKDWTDVTGDRIDPRRTYRARLPSGAEIDLFFYDGPASRAVAFDRLLSDGAVFARRLAAIGGDEPNMLAHVSTDGETYGHHHRFGDMALAYALHVLDKDPSVRLTNYGEFRELCPAEYEVEILEDTSWSCAHGVERWRSDCGCHTGGPANWNQAWRAPLRGSLDWLRDELAALFEQHGGQLFLDPWEARNDYIEVVLNRSPAALAAFFARHARDLPDRAGQVKALQLLEMQRHAMLMYTSCGWFFNDLAGTEPVQLLAYAARAIGLAQTALNVDLEQGFVQRLRAAESNDPEHGDGGRIYESYVKPARIDLRRVVAHHAVRSLFDPSDQLSQVYCYDVEQIDLRRHSVGKAKLVVGKVVASSRVTLAETKFCYAAIHFGEHNVFGGVRRCNAGVHYDELCEELAEAFARADLMAIHRSLDRHFEDRSFSLGSLFRDARAEVMPRILEAPLLEAEIALQRVYEHHAPLMRYLAGIGIQAPPVLHAAARFVVNQRIKLALKRVPPDADEISIALADARNNGIELEELRLGYLWEQALERLADRLAADPDDLGALERIIAVTEAAASSQLAVGLWRVQNVAYALSRSKLPVWRERTDPVSMQWTERCERLCDLVRLEV